MMQEMMVWERYLLYAFNYIDILGIYIFEGGI